MSELLDTVSPGAAVRMSRGGKGGEDAEADAAAAADQEQPATADAEAVEAGVAQMSLGEEAPAASHEASSAKAASAASPAPTLSAQKSVESYKLAIEER